MRDASPMPCFCFALPCSAAMSVLFAMCGCVTLCPPSSARVVLIGSCLEHQRGERIEEWQVETSAAFVGMT